MNDTLFPMPQLEPEATKRAATTECVNAIARSRGLRQFLVRGIPKCLAVLTLFALAQNAMRAVDLVGARGSWTGRTTRGPRKARPARCAARRADGDRSGEALALGRRAHENVGRPTESS